MRKFTQALLITLITVSITGCFASYLGPKTVKTDRIHYNDIVRDTDNEQILKNVVRLRYLEDISSMSVTNVTASYNLTRALNLTNVSDQPPTNWSWASLGVSPGVSVSDSPTISYIPQTDSAFVRSLLTPISFADFVLLANSTSRDPILLLGLVIENIGDFSSHQSTRGTALYYSPIDANYYRSFVLLNNLYWANMLKLSPITYNKMLGLMIEYKGNSKTNGDFMELKKLLHVPPHFNNIILLDKEDYTSLVNQSGVLVPKHTEDKPRNVVYVQLRSVYSLMAFIAHGVEIPQKDIDAHFAMGTKGSNGHMYSWGPLMKNIFVVHTTNYEPYDDVLVKTFVNDHWFYIKASDLNTKMTFAFLVRLITLAAVVPNEQAGPALTLAVGSPQ